MSTFISYRQLHSVRKTEVNVWYYYNVLKFTKYYFLNIDYHCSLRVYIYIYIFLDLYRYINMPIYVLSIIYFRKGFIDFNKINYVQFFADFVGIKRVETYLYEIYKYEGCLFVMCFPLSVWRALVLLILHALLVDLYWFAIYNYELSITLPSAYLRL
jgi:hypothetical protein